MKIKELRAILDAIAKEHNGEDTEVAMFSDNSHGSGAWEYADVDHIVEFPDDNTIYLAADFDYHENDPYDVKVKAKYTDVSDALKGDWAKEFKSPYCEDCEYDEEKEQALIDEIAEKSKQGVLDLYKHLADMTGEKPPEKYEDCMISVEEFERRMKELSGRK